MAALRGECFVLLVDGRIPEDRQRCAMPERPVGPNARTWRASVCPFSRCRQRGQSAGTWSWRHKTQLAAARYRARFWEPLPPDSRTMRHRGDRVMGYRSQLACGIEFLSATGPCDADVDKGRRTNVFDTAIVTGARATIVEESLAATQQDGHNRNMHLINERSTQVLLDSGCATSDKDITVSGRLECCTEGYFNPAVNEI